MNQAQKDFCSVLKQRADDLMSHGLLKLYYHYQREARELLTRQRIAQIKHEAIEEVIRILSEPGSGHPAARRKK